MVGYANNGRDKVVYKLARDGILKRQGNVPDAMAAYRRAVSTLDTIRPEVAVRYGGARTSFRESMGAVYFELVDLLLRRSAELADRGQSTALLVEARDVVEDVRLQHGTLACPGGLAGKTFTVNGLAQTQTDVLLRVDYLDGTASNQRLTPDAPTVTIPERPSALEVVSTYTALGIEHILLGIDHLLFVLALLLLVNGVGRLVATVTAFTLAHSVTLGAATLGFVHVPPAPVEAVIALSILFLASELARRSLAATSVDAANLTARFPWVVAFAFGLLHGFGFAGALSEVGMPAAAVPLALLFFNVGVEIGQLAFIAAVFAKLEPLKAVASLLPVA